MSKPEPNWNTVEVDYRAGIKSLRVMATENGITEGAIRKRAKRDSWERDLAAKIKPAKVILEAGDLDRAGFVYVIYLDDTANERFYKIGMAGSFNQRFQNHQCASPFDICVACAYYVGNMRREEKALHSAFDHKRIRGEWFQLDRDDLLIISQRALLI